MIRGNSGSNDKHKTFKPSVKSTYLFCKKERNESKEKYIKLLEEVVAHIKELTII